ncbi:MAG: polysaccharide biosynthesis/export family protein [Terriglobia bacterium]
MPARTRKQAGVRDLRCLAKATALGFSISLLTSLAPAAAQQQSVAPAVQSVVASKPASVPAARATDMKVESNDYTVSPEDLLDVNILDVPEVTRTYRVSSNGFLTLPLLPEPVPAAGETLDQLSHLIASKFRDAGMLNNAQVTVSLRETRLNTILVSGEVKSPQSYAVFGPTRLLDVLVKAGGLAPDAGNDAIVTRGEIGERADLIESTQTGGVDPSTKGKSFTLDIRKLVQTGADQTNILLYPGDRVTVQRAALIYIMGAVTRPGGYVLNETRQNVTVLKALAMAGDVTNIAKKSRITILRRDPAGPEEKRKEIPVDYKAMVKGQTVDIGLKPDDILYVPESGRVKALRASVTAAINVATSSGPAMIIYH